jgi:cell wall-associated NlpC family hydrolase
MTLLAGCASSPSRAPRAQAQAGTTSTAAVRSPEMVFQALAQTDVPYHYGGNSPASGFDCSGLVAHVYRQAFGIVLPHNTRAQSELGIRIRAEDLQPGDLVFYNTQGQPYSHVGIFLGDGRFIHAPKTGSAVRVENMSNRYWTKRYSGARRIAGT